MEQERIDEIASEGYTFGGHPLNDYCVTCAFQDTGMFHGRLVKYPADGTCQKYPQGVRSKPREIIYDNAPCPFYEREAVSLKAAVA